MSSTILETIRDGVHFKNFKAGISHPMSELATNFAGFFMIPIAFCIGTANLDLGLLAGGISVALFGISNLIHLRANYKKRP